VLSREDKRIDPERMEQLGNRAAVQIQALETLLLDTCRTRLAPAAKP